TAVPSCSAAWRRECGRRSLAVIVAHVVIVVETVAAFAVVHGFGPCVGEQEIKAVRDPFLQLHLQAVIAGVVAIADIIDRLRVAVLKERPETGIVTLPGNRLVAVLVKEPVTAHIANVRSLYGEGGRNLVWDRES